jgi:hypothetical protein
MPTLEEYIQSLAPGTPVAADDLLYIEPGGTGRITSADLYTQVYFLAAPTGATDALKTAALQADINASPEGSHIIFPDAEWLLTSTLQLPHRRRYSGSFWNSGTTLKMANGANLDAVVASATWFSASATPTSGDPIIVEHLKVDGNKANQTSGLGHGLVGMNYYSTVQFVNAVNTRGEGIMWTSLTLAGNGITNTCVEVLFFRNQTTGTDLSGIRLLEATTTGKVTDCWFEDNICWSSGEAGIRIDNAAGTYLAGNHTYATGTDGYRIGRAFRTRLIGNYAEGWGGSTTAGTYAGINAFTSPMISDGALQLDGNILAGPSTPAVGTQLYGIAARVASGATGRITITGNSCEGRTHSTPTVGIILSNQDAAAVMTGTMTGNLSTAWDTNILAGSTGTILVAMAGNNGGVVSNTTFTATPTIRPQTAAAAGGVWRMVLTGNVTSVTMVDGHDAQQIILQIVQDGTGGRTWAWPASIVGAPTIASAANAVTTVPLVYIASTDLWYAM